MQKTHKVLLLGSGLMTPPLIEHLIAFGDTKITVASNVISQAQNLVKQYGEHYLSAVYLDIKNLPELESLISRHDHVISFIPPWMHTPICEACLRLGKNMTTSSYVSPDMEKMHNDVKSKGLVFLNECGLDPGIDVLGTMKIVHEAQDAGFKVVSYESYCGGIPVADQADNPLGYKFSWNPGAGIKASRNTAIFMKDGKRVVTTAPLKCAEYRDDFSVSMKLESYPNRDSTVFQERFGMKDCHTFIRGTLRFAGFSSIISAFHDIGLTSDDKAPQSVKILRDLLEFRLQNTSFTSHPNQKFIEKATSGMSSQDVSLMKKAFMKIDFSHLKGNEHKTHQAITSIVKTMKFLGFFETNCTVKNDGSQSCLDILSQVMAVRLAMDDQDRDLVFMRHIFHIKDPRTNETWEHTSTMVASGESEASGGKTMMSKTVGITCGIATRMVLEGKIREKGVLSPITREIYNPILSELEKRGIRMIEESQNPEAMAKMTSTPQAKM